MQYGNESPPHTVVPPYGIDSNHQGLKPVVKNSLRIASWNISSIYGSSNEPNARLSSVLRDARFVHHLDIVLLQDHLFDEESAPDLVSHAQHFGYAAFVEPAVAVVASGSPARRVSTAGVATLVSRRLFDAAEASRRVGAPELGRSSALRGHYLRVDLCFGDGLSSEDPLRGLGWLSVINVAARPGESGDALLRLLRVCGGALPHRHAARVVLAGDFGAPAPGGGVGLILSADRAWSRAKGRRLHRQLLLRGVMDSHALCRLSPFCAAEGPFSPVGESLGGECSPGVGGDHILVSRRLTGAGNGAGGDGRVRVTDCREESNYARFTHVDSASAATMTPTRQQLIADRGRPVERSGAERAVDAARAAAARPGGPRPLLVVDLALSPCPSLGLDQGLDHGLSHGLSHGQSHGLSHGQSPLPATPPRAAPLAPGGRKGRGACRPLDLEWRPASAGASADSAGTRVRDSGLMGSIARFLAVDEAAVASRGGEVGAALQALFRDVLPNRLAA